MYSILFLLLLTSSFSFGTLLSPSIHLQSIYEVIEPKSNAVNLNYWDPIIAITTEAHPYRVALGDANNDGYNDIITDTAYSTLKVYLWNPSLNNWSSEITLSSTQSGVFTIEDANNDGFNDIIVLGGYSHNVLVLPWNNVSQTWDSGISLPVAQWPNGLYVNDLNNDGYNDIATATPSGDVISIILWNSNLNDWDSYFDKAVGNHPQQLSIEDVNNDTYNDLVITREPNIVSILLWNDSSSDWNPQINKTAGNDPSAVCVGDLNTDSYSDIVVTNYLGESVSIFLWNHSLNDWDSTITKTVGKRPYDLDIGDINNDGNNDIAVTDYTSYTPNVPSFSVLFWNSTALDWDLFNSEIYGASTSDISIGDLNDDNYNDVLIPDNHDELMILQWDTNSPSLNILSPFGNQTFGSLAPNFSLSIVELNLKDTWYNLNGTGEFHFTGIEGSINQNGWDCLSEGNITIKFYAEDYVGNTDFKEIKIVKKLPPQIPSPPGIP